MPRLTLLKSSASSQSSSSSGSRRSSMLSEGSSPVSYVQFPGMVSTQTQPPSQPGKGKSTPIREEYAEMLDDDNMAWGKPKKNSRR